MADNEKIQEKILELQKNKFGGLNPWDEEPQEEFVYDLASESLFSNVFASAKQKYSKNIVNGRIEFKAIVLFAQEIDPKSSLGIFNFDIISDFFLQLSGASNTKTVKVIARIPELHAHLPEPSESNTVKNNYDWQVLSMYPAFEGPSELGVPEIGSIVKVTFSNVLSQEGPIYLGSLDGGNVAKSDTGDKKTKHFNGNKTLEDLDASQISGSDDLYYATGVPAKTKTPYSIQVVDEPQDFKGRPRKNKPVQIVLHESVTSTKTGAINTLKHNGTGVHYLVDIDGKIYKLEDPSVVVYHAKILNNNSIGIEFVNKYLGNYAEANQKTVYGAWVDRAGVKNRDQLYIVPSLEQLESTWKLVKNLTLQWEIPMAFPGVNTKNSQGTERNDGLKFSWTRVKGAETQPGIQSHNRTAHADGIFIEHYILCRANNRQPTDAYLYTIQQASKGKYTQIP